MAKQGWYPDPGGEPGMYRYFDGAAWSEALSPTPLPGPPGQYAGMTPLTAGSGGFNPAGGGSYGSYGPGSADMRWVGGDPKPKRSAGPWIGVGVGVVALAVVIVLVVRLIGGIGGLPVNDPTNDPGGTETTQVCPDEPKNNVRAEHPVDGRVYGGKLSYPQLTGDWSPVTTDEVRIPFGRDVAGQDILIHTNTSGNPTKDGWEMWVVSVTVGELYAGDGFFSPEEGSKIVNKCIFGKFYGETTKVTANTLRSEAYTLDGRDGWITETNLSFNIPNLPTTSELAIVIIVKTSEMSSSIFFASIPNDAQQYKPDVDAAIADLHVVT